MFSTPRGSGMVGCRSSSLWRTADGHENDTRQRPQRIGDTRADRTSPAPRSKRRRVHSNPPGRSVVFLALVRCPPQLSALTANRTRRLRAIHARLPKGHGPCRTSGELDSTRRKSAFFRTFSRRAERQTQPCTVRGIESLRRVTDSVGFPGTLRQECVTCEGARPPRHRRVTHHKDIADTKVHGWTHR